MEKVTVVIPTYRAAGFIRTTLESVAAQTLLPAEMIVVDDRSPDDTVGVVRAWGESAPFPVRVIELPENTGGPAEPMNVGVAATRTRYVATLDHDDWMEPDKLRLQTEALARHPQAGLCFGNAVLFRGHDPTDVIPGPVRVPLMEEYDSDRPDHLIPPGVMSFMHLVDTGTILSCSNMVFPVDAWRQFGPFEREHNPVCDYLFKLRLCAHTDTVYVPKVLFRKARHSTNLYDTTYTIEQDRFLKERGQDTLLCISDFRGMSEQMRRELSAELTGIGYGRRCRGRFASATRFYMAHLRLFGPSVATLRTLAVMPVRAIGSLLRRKNDQPTGVKI